MQIDSKSTGSIIQATYKMNDNILESKLELKDLGVIVDNHLTFRNHIAEKVNKANQIMGLIRQAFVFLDKHNFNLLYKSLVRPHIENGNIVCSPFRKADINLIKNVQRRPTRFIPEINKLDYQERLEKLDLSTLAYRPFRGSIIETYKILHNLYDANRTNSLFELKESNTRGHKFAVKTKLSGTSIRQNFFSLLLVNLWNREQMEQIYQRMQLKHQTLICLKTDLIDIVEKEIYYLMLTLTIPMCMHYLY